MKKYAAAAIQAVICLIILYFACINAGNTSVIKFMPNSASTALNTSIVFVCVYILGVLTGLVQTFVKRSIYRSQIEFYSRKNEKLSQQNEIDSDNKEVLQRRIAALETALSNALKNKQQ